jgi:hypothetical protein
MLTTQPMTFIVCLCGGWVPREVTLPLNDYMEDESNESHTQVSGIQNPKYKHNKKKMFSVQGHRWMSGVPQRCQHYLTHVEGTVRIVIHFDGVKLRLWTVASNGLCSSFICREYGEPWWNDIDGKTEELGEKPVPVPLCPPQIPNGLIQAWTRVCMVRGWRLTA